MTNHVGSLVVEGGIVVGTEVAPALGIQPGPEAALHAGLLRARRFCAFGHFPEGFLVRQNRGLPVLPVNRFIFATKRVKMAPVELQLYYRFVRKQGILKDAREVHRAIPQMPAPLIRPGIDHRPLLFGTVAGCLLATASLAVLAGGPHLRPENEIGNDSSSNCAI